MKNSNRSGIGSSIRRSVSILLMFATLAVTIGAKASDLKNKQADNGTNVSLAHQSDRNSTFDASQSPSGDASQDSTPRLIATNVAFFCVTNYGTFPLNFPLLWGSPCYAQFNYWPYNAYGIAE
jgi:hypothetical protein